LSSSSVKLYNVQLMALSTQQGEHLLLFCFQFFFLYWLNLYEKTYVVQFCYLSNLLIIVQVTRK